MVHDEQICQNISRGWVHNLGLRWTIFILNLPAVASDTSADGKQSQNLRCVLYCEASWRGLPKRMSIPTMGP